MEKNLLPVLILREMVLFPSRELRIEFDTMEDKQLLSLIESCYQGNMLVVTPVDFLETNFEIGELPFLGVEAKLKLKMEMPNGKTRIILEGLERRRVLEYHIEDQTYMADSTFFGEEDMDPKEEAAYARSLLKQLHQYIKQVPYISNAVLSEVRDTLSLSRLTDLVADMLPTTFSRKLDYLNEVNPVERVKMLRNDMSQDIKVFELEQAIDEKVEKELAESQKEFVLREKLQVIKKELGESNDKDDEINSLKQRVNALKCPPKVKQRLKLELRRYEMASPSSPEVGIIRDYVDWLLSLPWSYQTRDITSLHEVKRILDSTHYGLEKVKDRILEYLAVKQNTDHSKSPILCLVGPPGVGKTSLAMSIAKSLGRRTTKMSVGGIHDEAEILGHRRTYVGANPGRIIQGMRRVKTTNPVFIIDEIDKMTKDIKGDPASALLEVLDPEQNMSFVDHYIEEEYDLSKVMFIATANYVEQIPPELLDRLELITISSYTEYEKLDIAKNYLIPRGLSDHGLTEIEVQFEDEAILSLIRFYTREAGVRELERVIASILRKIVKNFLLDKTIASCLVTSSLVEEYLGPKKYTYTENDDFTQSGVVNGMAYTPFGGDILPMEVTTYPGSGTLILTGSLGKVMQESAQIAFSYLKSKAQELEISMDLVEKSDVHIHVPEGAVMKDGPSAGIALTTALISLFLDQKVPKTIAMTGEMTLRGRILPIGGLKEKVIGAHRSGMKDIYLPKANQNDLEEIPEDVKKDLTFHLVDHYQEIYQSLFSRKKRKQDKKKELLENR